MNVLVVGVKRVDAGKTTFSVGLLESLGGVGFKPRAGNDYWFDYDDCAAALATGRLFGKDARRLQEASQEEIQLERMNPVHRLWQPAPRGSGFIGPADRRFVLDRYGENAFVVNQEATVPEQVREQLALDNARMVDSVETLNAVIANEYVPLFDAVRERIMGASPVVVESYGDVARPIQGLEFAVVAAVEPLRVRYYDGDRFQKACEVTTGNPLDGQLEERVPDVIELLDPLGEHRLPPLSKRTREDPTLIADAYADAYDPLL